MGFSSVQELVQGNLLLVISTCIFLALFFAYQQWTKDTAPFAATRAFGKSNRIGFFEGRKKYGPTFTLNLLVKKMTVVTNPKDIVQISNEPEKKLAMTEAVENMIRHVTSADDFALEVQQMDGIHGIGGARPELMGFLKDYMFSKENLQKVSEYFLKKVNDKLAKWEETGKVDIALQSSDLVLSITTAVMYGEDFLQKNPEFPMWVYHFEALGFTPLLMAAPWLPFGPAVKFRELKKKIRGAIKALIVERRAKLAKGEPLDDSYCSQLLTFCTQKNIELCDEGYTSHTINLTFAAHINTAGTLAWTMLHSAHDPNLLKKLQDAVDEITKKNTPLHVNDLNQVKLFDVLIKEAIRQYAGMNMVPRLVKEDYKLTDGKIVKKGNLIVPFPAFLEDVFSDNSTFNIDRWERKEAENITGFYPFGSGPHSCTGRLFAGTVIKTTFYAIFSKYVVEIDGEFPSVDATKSAGMNTPGGNPIIKLKKRVF